ncbi:MAG: quinone oxidoreductase family protein [Gammaproteobacteria bacterium]
MTHAIRIHELGGSDQLKWEAVDLAAPGPGEVQIQHTAVGLNFIDVYFRTGLYPAPDLPFTPGLEGAGEVTAVGDEVTELSVGDRVAYAGGPLGSYSETRNMPAGRLVKVPDGIGDGEAAAMMLQGMTAEYLLRRTYAVQPGDTILLHAAAGGVGQIATQWAKHLGATVIGTVGSEEKAEIARGNGCDHIILYRDEDIAERVKEITNGEGVPVVYDAVGKDTFEASLNSLRKRGMMVSFGNASGKVDAFEPVLLSQKGSLFITRPTLFDYTATREDLLESANALFDVVRSGAVKIHVGQEFALSEAKAAHDALEGRQTVGSTILIP